MSQQQETPLSDVQQLQLNVYFKFISDAGNLLASNPLPAAHEARCRLEEAFMWGKLAISAFQISQPATPVDEPNTAQPVQDEGVSKTTEQQDAA